MEKMIEITEKDTIKRLEMEVLMAIHRFCNDNHLQYYLACGTLIGAIRHKGFIPWDDDIDIYMRRRDYDFFIHNFGDDSFGVNSCVTNKRYCLSYAKAFSKSNVKVEKGFPKKIEQGVDVDIFVLNDCYDIEYAKRKESKRRRIQLLWQISTIDKNNVSSVKGFIAFLLSPFFKPFRNLLARKMDDLTMADNKKGQELHYYQTFSVVSRRIHILKKEWFDNPVLHWFENGEFFIPNGYDDVLREEFGDYMVIPPLEKQRTQHNYRVFKK